MHIFGLLGLTLVIIAWLIQLIYMLHDKRNLISAFLAIYIIGVIGIVIDSFIYSVNDMAFLNIISVLVSTAVFIRLHMPTDKPVESTLVKVKKGIIKSKKKRK